MDALISYFASILGWVMRLFGQITNDYGLIIILFTLASKVILLPISFYVQKNSVKMVKMQPELNRIEARNILDKDKFYEEQLKLFKREKYHVSAGILPLIIQIVLVLGLIQVIYNPLTHLMKADKATAAALNTYVAEQQGVTVEQLGSSAQLSTIKFLQTHPDATGQFTAKELEIAQEARKLNLSFFGLDLAAGPSLNQIDTMWLFPLMAALSSFLMSYFQNKTNVLQKEQGFWGQWGMAAFLTLFSLYFGFVVAGGVALYWIASNAFSVVQLFFLNAIYPPSKYIDYEELESSKVELKNAQKSLPPRRKWFDHSEITKREKADYKRFFKVPDEDMQLVFYSEQSGFYKYYKGIIEHILNNSNIIIHYVTSDPNDAAFSMESTYFRPYYIGESRLIYLMMKIRAKVVVMTMPDLQTYHIKRSYVRDDIDYVYVPHAMGSQNLLFREGALDHYDTIFSAHIHQTEEIRLMEQHRNSKKKRVLKCGYPLLDEMIASHQDNKSNSNQPPMVLIAPSWTEDNIFDSCLDDMLASLFETDFRVIIRPHPQYVRLFPNRMNAIIERYGEKVGDKFEIQVDFSSNETVYSADLLITDWSNISQEYSLSTKRPTLFVNTKMKVVNENYKDIDKVPFDITVRDTIGVSIEKSRANEIGKIAADMLNRKEEFADRIEDELKNTIYNVGNSAEVGANYIIKRVKP